MALWEWRTLIQPREFCKGWTLLHVLFEKRFDALKELDPVGLVKEAVSFFFFNDELVLLACLLQRFGHFLSLLEIDDGVFAAVGQ